MLKILENAGHTHEFELNDTLTLPYEQRTKGRLKTVTDGGAEAGLFLERGKVLQSGDVLKTECGRYVGVRCAEEAVVTATCEDWAQFSRACYHLGNRHTTLQIGERWLRFKPDHVLEELARHLGLRTEHGHEVFSPETGAYHSGGHHHQH